MMVLLFSAIFMMNGKPVPANNHYVPPITYQTNRFEARLPSLDSIMAGYGFLGLTYGIYMHELGFSFLYPMLLAITVYAGSAEFLLGNMLLGSFHPLQTFLMVLMVNARHLYLRTLDARQIQGTRMEEVLPHLRSRQFHHSEHGDYPPLPHNNEEKIGARMMMEKVTN